MSKLLQEPKYYGKQIENLWINNIFSSHDLLCGCNDTILHLLTVLNRQGKAKKPEDEIRNIKCLITGDEDSTQEDDVFGPGELEALFQEDGDAEKPSEEDSDCRIG